MNPLHPDPWSLMFITDLACFVALFVMAWRAPTLPTEEDEPGALWENAGLVNTNPHKKEASK